MKRPLVLLLFVVTLVSFASCTPETPEDSQESGGNISAVSEASENSVKELSDSDYLLMKSFGELWLSDQYYIDVKMKVEYDPSKLESAAVPESKTSSGSESSSGTKSSSGSESSAGLTTVNYDYIIAVDNEANKAGLIMNSDKGSKCSVVKDNYLYEINHANKTYTKEPYSLNASDFGQNYTTRICLGLINKCSFQNTGNTVYNGKDVIFEKYNIENSKTSGQSVVTYYFEKNGKPVAEVYQTGSGMTTFEFRVVSKTILVKDILEVPADYKEVKSENTSSKS